MHKLTEKEERAIERLMATGNEVDRLKAISIRKWGFSGLDQYDLLEPKPTDSI